VPPETSSLRNAIPFGEYSTAGLRPADRFEHWRDYMSGVCEMVVPEGFEAERFEVRSTKWMFDGALLIAGDYAPIAKVRSPRHARTDQLDHYNIKLRPDSRQQIDIDGRRFSVAPRQPVLGDMAQADRFSWEAGAGMMMYLPRDEVDALLPRPLDLHGVVLQGAGAAVLAEHMVALAGALRHLTPEEAPALKRATLYLLAAALAPSVKTLGLARTELETALRRRVRKFIEANLVREDLTVDLLCKTFQVSRSTLFRVFENAGGIANYIRERRLVRVHALLAAPHERRYLSRIAEDHGFKNATHFSRAFRAQFGYSPREIQAHSATAPASRGRLPAAGATPFEQWVQSLGG
jgi:AraC-like DNA-binding protein